MSSNSKKSGGGAVFGAFVFALLFAVLSPSPTSASEEKRFGRWTSGFDHSVPGEKLCWLINGEVAFYIWAIEEQGYRGEWLTQYGSEEASFPRSFYADIDGNEFSGEESIGGPALIGAMKAGLILRYEYVLPSGTRRGSVSLIGFTKGYRYCLDQVS
jgi:hypothetical protein